MNRALVLLLLLVNFYPLHSMENGSGLSLGVLGIGVAYEEEKFNPYLYGRLLNFTYQTDVGLGVTVSPLVFYLEEIEDSSLTFANGLIFFDFLQDDERFILGPFVSLHALGYNNPKFIEFRSGITFSFRDLDAVQDSIFSTDLVFVELGYKYNKNNKHGVYVHVGIDMLRVIMFYIEGRINEET